MNNDHTFRIGISMAGAISAGAYTAGVIDYLFEALENWQKAKDLKLPGVPQHNVLIEVMSGASAGGMTAVVTAAALQKNFPHVNQENYLGAEIYKNPLFDSWVNLTENAQNDMMSQMLDSTDILAYPANPDKEVRSLFNSLFIEKIAKQNINGAIRESNTNRKYLADDLELLTTITNLRGFNYVMKFITAVGEREDRMTMHKDLVHFQLNPSGIYKGDGKIPVHFNTPEGLNKNLLIDAAIATGAFPVGLAPRTVVRDPKYINDNPLLKINHSIECIVNPAQKSYIADCVDGGVINNEPYDLAETILFNRRREEIEKENGLAEAKKYKAQATAGEFDTTVLMIDPFPNYEDVPDPEYYCLPALKFAVPHLLSAMRQQLMLKTEVLEKAYSSNDFSRFMIAPIRTMDGKTQKYSIACGSLGGFGGFFSKNFRIHDFMLGRRNCQRFIQNYFCVPVSANNKIINFGYDNLDENYKKMLKSGNSDSFPIIPDIRISADYKKIMRPGEEKEFPYPKINLTYLMSLEKKVETRFAVILNNATNGKDPRAGSSQENPVVQKIRKKSLLGKIFSPVKNFIAKRFILIGKSAVKDISAEKFIDSVITDMYTRELLNDDYKKR